MTSRRKMTPKKSSMFTGCFDVIIDSELPIPCFFAHG